MNGEAHATAHGNAVPKSNLWDALALEHCRNDIVELILLEEKILRQRLSSNACNLHRCHVATGTESLTTSTIHDDALDRGILS
jgi:hypothetical protein